MYIAVSDNHEMLKENVCLHLIFNSVAHECVSIDNNLHTFVGFKTPVI